MSAPSEILDLVVRFRQQHESYKSGQYNETQVRREFLDPVFKAPDYCSRIGGTHTRIDGLVHDLYSLAEEEIQIVECKPS